MILDQFSYAAPETVAEVVATLRDNPGSTPLAGGQTLLTAMRRGVTAPSMLVDLRRVGELGGVTDRADGGLRAGATTPFVDLAGAGERYPALADALEVLGDPQVRNRGTLGGNLTEDGADLPAVVLALGGTVAIAGSDGERTVAADRFYAGGGAGSLRPAEILTAVELPPPAPGAVSAYVKFTDPASRYPICGVAVELTLTRGGVVRAARVAVTGATTRPARLADVEAALVGNTPPAPPPTATLNGSAVDNRVASAEYRNHLVGVLLGRALSRAFGRAGR
jgi:carbon-monoxide dehydrogenase medium subunit